MNRYFSDFFPAALVRDMRRSLRSRAYIAMLMLALLAAVWVQYDAIQEARETMEMGGGGWLFLIAAVVLCFVVPNRAGEAVSADAKVKGTNFMMLTPLSSRRIVWGTWFSALVQLLLVAAFGALILWWRLESTPAAAPLGTMAHSGLRALAHSPALQLTPAQIQTLYALLVGVGALMCAVFMFLAQLNRFFRLAAAGFVLALGLGWVVENVLTMEWFTQEHYNPIAEFLNQFTGYSLYLHLADGILALLLMLELARRSYAAPAENCSFSVRLLALLPVLSVPCLYYILPDIAEETLRGQFDFGVEYAVFALMCDALLPTYSLSAHDKRALRWLPTYLQTPGVGQSALCLVLGMAVCWGVGAWLPQPLDVPAGEPMYTMYDERYLASGMRYLTSAYLFLCSLLLTELMCRRTNVNRPVVCAAVLVVLCVVSSIGSMLVTGEVRGYVVAALPGVNTPARFVMEEGEMQLYIRAAITACCLLLTLAALMWRGRRRG